jgi:hypothetical protein
MTMKEDDFKKNAENCNNLQQIHPVINYSANSITFAQWI